MPEPDFEIPPDAGLPPDFAPLPGAGLGADVTRSTEADARADADLPVDATLPPDFAPLPGAVPAAEAPAADPEAPLFDGTTVRLRGHRPRTVVFEGAGADSPSVTLRWLDDGRLTAEYDPARLSESARAVLDAVSTIVPPPEPATPPGRSADEIPQRYRDLAFNAVGPALDAGGRGEWLTLAARRAVADAVLAAVMPEILNTGAPVQGTEPKPEPRQADEIRDLFVGKLPIGYADVAMEIAGPLIADRDEADQLALNHAIRANENHERAERAEAERDHWHRRATGIDGKIAEAVTARADWRERCLNAERERDHLSEADAELRRKILAALDDQGDSDAKA